MWRNAVVTTVIPKAVRPALPFAKEVKIPLCLKISQKTGEMCQKFHNFLSGKFFIFVLFYFLRIGLKDFKAYNFDVNCSKILLWLKMHPKCIQNFWIAEREEGGYILNAESVKSRFH